MEDYIIQQLKKELKETPYKIKDILSVCLNSMNDYERSIKDKRDSIAYNALSLATFCVDSKMFNKLDPITRIALMIDTVFYLFPKGEVKGHSELEVILFNEFKYLCIKYNIIEDTNWLVGVKSQEYYDWVKIVIGR